MNLRRTSKKQAKIKLALQGCAGSGKTYSALLLAYGLCGEWSKIAVIDSENGSADLYAHLGNYNVLPLQDSFTPETYMEAIGICENAGMEVIIIDLNNFTETVVRKTAFIFCWSMLSYSLYKCRSHNLPVTSFKYEAVVPERQPGDAENIITPQEAKEEETFINRNFITELSRKSKCSSCSQSDTLV